MPRNDALDPKAVAVASRAMPDNGRELRMRASLVLLCSLTRLKIVRALAEAELAAGDLALVIDRSRSTTSQHLRILREAGAVAPTRVRNVVRYRLTDAPVARMLADVSRLVAAA